MRLRHSLPSTLILAMIVAGWLSGGACAKTDRQARTGSHAPEPGAVAARATPGALPVAAPRKLIHRREARVRVADLAAAHRDLIAATRAAGGFVARSRLDAQAAADERSVELVLRIPPARLDGLMDRLARLGTVLSETSRAEDVTEQHADVVARLANARRTEARLLELQARGTASLSDVLAAEREVHRVRELVEQTEAQLKTLDGLVELATVTVTLVPRTATEPTPPFGHTIAVTFHGSVEALVRFGQGLLLLVVAMAPWLAWLAPLGLGGLLWARRRRRAAADAGTGSPG